MDELPLQVGGNSTCPERDASGVAYENARACLQAWASYRWSSAARMRPFDSGGFGSGREREHLSTGVECCAEESPREVLCSTPCLLTVSRERISSAKANHASSHCQQHRARFFPGARCARADYCGPGWASATRDRIEASIVELARSSASRIGKGFQPHRTTSAACRRTRCVRLAMRSKMSSLQRKKSLPTAAIFRDAQAQVRKLFDVASRQRARECVDGRGASAVEPPSRTDRIAQSASSSTSAA